MKLSAKTEELIVGLTMILVLSPSAEWNHKCSGVVIARVVQCLVSDKFGSFHWFVTTLNCIYHFPVIHHITNAIRSQYQKCISAVLYLVRVKCSKVVIGGIVTSKVLVSG